MPFNQTYLVQTGLICYPLAWHCTNRLCCDICLRLCSINLIYNFLQANTQIEVEPGRPIHLETIKLTGRRMTCHYWRGARLGWGWPRSHLSANIPIIFSHQMSPDRKLRGISIDQFKNMINIVVNNIHAHPAPRLAHG